MHHHHHHYPNCLNCGHELAAHYKFCPNCGQHPTDGKTSFGHLLEEFFEGVFHLDGKLIKTLRHVFIPGKLTEEFFKGRHKSYAAPFQLFLVLGGLYFFFISKGLHESEEKLLAAFEKEKKAFIAKQVLQTIDSTNKTFDIYQNQTAVKIYSDSVIKKTYYKFNPKSDIEIADDYNYSLRKLIEAQKNKDKNLSALQLDSIIKKLQQDSVQFMADIADEKDISTKAAEKIAYQYADSITKKETKNDAPVNSFMRGINSGFKVESKRDNSIQTTKDILKRDSMNLLTKSNNGLGYKISKSDLINLKDDEILEKYKVHGFWQRLFIRQTAHFYQTGGDLLHFLLSKSLWIILASMLPIAFFLKLLYFRRHKFLIEHFLFLMHFLCFFFIVSIIYLGLPMLLKSILGETAFNASSFKMALYVFDVIYFLVVPIGLWFAMKQFYKQGWIKTSVKFLIFNMGAIFIGLVVSTIGLLIGFAMF